MNWLKKYKEKECKTWIGKFFQRLAFTWNYKIALGIILVLIGAVGFNFVQEGGFWDDILSYIYLFGLSILIVTVIVGMAYAWLINPIRDLKEKDKK